MRKLFFIFFISISCTSNSVIKSTAGLGQLSGTNSAGVKFRFYEIEYEVESCKNKIKLHSVFSENNLGKYEFVMIASANEEKDRFAVFNFERRDLLHPYHQRVFVRTYKESCVIQVSMSIVPILDSIFIKDICENSNNESCEKVKREGEKDIEKFASLIEADIGNRLIKNKKYNSFIYDPASDTWLRTLLRSVDGDYKKLRDFSPVEIL